jgi:hypothetical protein
MFADTANIVYCLSFADQGEQTSVFPVSVWSKQTELRCFHFRFA